MDAEESGFLEVAHTADWEITVWAPNLVGLLEQAARGMYALSGVRLMTGRRVTKTIQVSGIDFENLLVQFLDEIIFIGEMEQLAFDSFNLEITLGNQKSLNLEAVLKGSLIAAQEKEIKAVTYHNLELHQTERGWAVNLVFDV